MFLRDTNILEAEGIHIFMLITCKLSSLGFCMEKTII